MKRSGILGRIFRGRPFLQVGLAAFVLAGALASTADAQVIRAFSSRYAGTDRGNFLAIGNTLMTCPDSATACANARAGVGSVNNNQDFTMVMVDVDSVDPGANSSSASLALPSGSTVRFAALYWGATSSSAGRNQVRLRTPASGAYTTLTASQLDVYGVAYHAFVDVTSLVAAGGSGSYTVADVKALTGANAYAGWSLVVVYADSTDTPHNVAVFDGFANVASGSGSVTIPLSGFVTPPSGTVGTRIGVVAYEGDLGSPGNSVRLNSTTLSNAVNAANNFFNSTVSVLGVHATAKTPNYVNQLGYDVDVADATGILANASTSASAQFAPGSDTYQPGALVFSTEIFQPLIAPNFSKTVTDVNGGYVSPGDVLEYTVTVANTGNDAADAFALTDAIPAGTTYVAGSLSVVSGANSGTKTDASGDDQAEYDSGGNRVVFRLGVGATSSAGGSIAASASTVVRFRVQIGAGVTNGTTISNLARATYTEHQLGGSVAVDSNTATISLNRPDLTMAKSHSSSFVRGASGTFSIVATNSGLGATSGAVTVSDTLPSGLVPTAASGTGWSCGIAGQAVTCTRSDALAIGASFPAISIVAGVSQGAASSLTNTATVSGGGQLDTSNDSASDPTTITSSADLAVSKSGPSSALAGTNVTYTVTVTNNGSSDAASVVVADPTPSGLTFVSNSGACSSAYPCALGSVAAGTSRTITTTYSVPVGYAAPGTITNTATVSSSTPDPVSSNDSATATTPVTPSTDLSVSKSGPASIVAGNLAVYTVVVSNLGGLAATSVSIADPTPAGLTFVSNSGACTTAYPCSLGSVEAGGTRTITSTFSVPASYAGASPVLNTATVSAATADPAAGNNSSTWSMAVTKSADLAVTKTGPASAVPGRNVVYTVVVTNDGSSDAAAVSVADPTPAGLSFVSNSGACTTAYPCSLGVVEAGGTRTITTTYAMPSSYSGPSPLGNTATVSSSTSDPVAGNNSATSSTPVVPSADLVLTKTGTATTIAGSDVIYTVTLRNDGPSDAAAVVVSDPTPSGLTFVSNSGACTTGYPCALGTVAAGTTRTITTTYSVPVGYSTPSTITNTATVSSAAADPTPSNDSATALTFVTPSADLAISKTGPASVIAGENLVYTITVTNQGGLSAPSVVVDDPAPAGLVFVSNAGDCSGAFPCSLGSLPAGESRSITSTWSVPASYAVPGTIGNTATVSSGIADSVAGNNTSTASTTVNASADLEIAKSGPASAVAGQDVVFTVTVANLGSSDASGVSVADAVPTGLLFVSNTGACTTAYPCALGTLAAGASRTITTTYAIPSGYTGPDPILNTATVTSATTDPAAGNDSATASVVLETVANLSISKAGPSSASAGQDLVFTVTVHNDGSSDAAAVSVADPTPAGLVFVSNAGDCTTAWPCSLGVVPAGATRTITSTYSVPSSYTAPDPIVNTATVSSSTTDPVPGDNASTTSTPVVVHADLAVVKNGPVSVTAGEDVVYSVTVSNTGPADAVAVVVADPTPSGLVFVSNAGDCSGAYPCSLGTIAAGGTRTITTTYSVPPSYSGPDPILNTASVTSSTADPVAGNDSSTSSVAVSRSADLSVAGSGPPSAVTGTFVTYTLTVTNDGVSDASAVMLAAAPQPGLVFVSNSGDCVSIFPCSLGTIAAGGTRTITTTYEIPSEYTAPTPMLTTMTVSSATPDPDPSDDSATLSTPVAASADLDIALSGPGAVIAGSNLVLLVEVGNNGPSDAFGVVAALPTPPGLTFVSNSGDCTTGYPCSLGLLDEGETRVIVSTYAVPPSYTSPDPIVSTATVSSSTPDPVSANDSSTFSSDLTIIDADLRLSKTGPASIVPGAEVEYTLVVTNDGPDDATGTIVTDPTPHDFTFVSNSGDCATAYPCSLGTLASGATRTITTRYSVPASYRTPDPARNLASVASGVGDSDGSDNFSEVTSTVAPLTDLAVSASGPATAAAGSDVVYTFVVTNDGPSDALSVSLANTPPPGLVFVSNTGGCASAYPCDLGRMAVGAVRTITSTYTIAASYPAPGPIVNTVTVVSADADVDAGDDTASVSTTVTTSADLALSKTGPATATPGEPLVYTVSVTNLGTSDASGVLVTDPTPAGLAFVSNSGACSGAYPCTLGTLAAGATATITSTYSVPSSYLAPDPIVNTATVSSSTTDPVAANDASTSSTPLSPRADLAINVAPPASATAGEDVVYTVTVTNGGSSDATLVSVANPAPSGLVFVSNSGACTGSYPCSLGTLAAGATATITTTYAMPSSYVTPDPLVNTATVSSATTDPDTGNNTSTASTPVLKSADLSVAISAPASVVAGGSLAYTITVTNAGSSDAQAVTLAGSTPPGLVFVSSSGDCVTAYPCALGSLPAGQSRVITVTYAVPSSYAAPGPIVGTVSVSSTTSDPDPAGDTATSSTTVTTSADLSITKTDATDPIETGAVEVYTITVSNAGPSDATGVVVTDTFDPSTTLVAYPGGCTVGSGSISCNVGSLASGAAAGFAISVRVGDAAPVDGTLSAGPCDGSEDLCNRATVAASQADPAGGNNLATQPTDVVPLSVEGLALSINDAPDSVVAGATLTYVLTYSNFGSATIRSARLQLVEDARTTFVSASPSPDVGDGEWILGDLAPGATGEIVVQVAVDGGVLDGDLLVAAATLSGEHAIRAETQEQTAVRDTQPNQAGLVVTKTSALAAIPSGGLVTFTIEVQNAGQATAYGTIVSDPLPDGFVYRSASPAPDGISGNSLAWYAGDLAAGESRSYLVYAETDDLLPAGTLLENIAFADGLPGSGTVESAGLHAEASETVSVSGPAPDCGLVARLRSLGIAQPGGEFVYRLLWNDPCDDAPATTIVHDLPVGATLVSVTGADAVSWTLEQAAGHERVVLDVGTVERGRVGAAFVRVLLSAGLAPGTDLSSELALTDAAGRTVGASDTSTVRDPGVLAVSRAFLRVTGSLRVVAGASSVYIVRYRDIPEDSTLRLSVAGGLRPTALLPLPNSQVTPPDGARSAWIWRGLQGRGVIRLRGQAEFRGPAEAGAQFSIDAVLESPDGATIVKSGRDVGLLGRRRGTPSKLLARGFGELKTQRFARGGKTATARVRYRNLLSPAVVTINLPTFLETKGYFPELATTTLDNAFRWDDLPEKKGLAFVKMAVPEDLVPQVSLAVGATVTDDYGSIVIERAKGAP